MAGVKKLRKIQLGDEGTPGIAVPATALWRGLGTLEDLSEVVFVEEDVGYLSGLDRTFIPKVGGQLKMDEVPATFEQLPYILMAGVESTAGVADGIGSGYVWTFNFPTTVAMTIMTYTIEGGDDQEQEEMAYCFVTDFSINGAADEAVKMLATWIGRQISVTDFSSPSLVTVEEILFNLGKIYIDAVAGSHGGTIKSNTLISMGLSVDTGLRAEQAADGEIYFSFQKQVGPEITCDLVFEHDGTAVAEKAAWLAQTPRLIRLIFEGSDLTAAGTYSKKTLIIDMTGKWEKFSALTDKDGNDIVTGTFRVRFNDTSDTFCDIIVVNELSALP